MSWKPPKHFNHIHTQSYSTNSNSTSSSQPQGTYTNGHGTFTSPIQPQPQPSSSSSSSSYPPSSSNQTISELANSFSNSNSNLNHSSNQLSKVKRQKSFRDKQWDSAFGPLSLNTFLRKDWIKYYILLLLLIIAVAIVTIFHHQIIVSLKPFADDLHELKINDFEIGWIIPIIILFIISFPPLFGHEIVIIICGLVWGLWIGFLIVSIGTFIGEIANYWTFKYACTKRAQRLERKDLNYACMCIVIRDGGFWIAFLARLSAIPSHLITPVFATTGMSLWIFSTATLLSMPKQLAGVYLGTLFNLESNSKSTSSKVIEYFVLIISFLVTLIAAGFIYKRMSKARPLVQAKWKEDQIDLNHQDHSNQHVDPYYGNGLISSEWEPIRNGFIEENVRMGRRTSEDDWSSLEHNHLIQLNHSTSNHYNHHPFNQISNSLKSNQIDHHESLIHHSPLIPAFNRKDSDHSLGFYPTHVSRSD